MSNRLSINNIQKCNAKILVSFIKLKTVQVLLLQTSHLVPYYYKQVLQPEPLITSSKRNLIIYKCYQVLYKQRN